MVGELLKVRVTAIAVFAREALVGYWVLNLDWFQQNMDAAEDPKSKDVDGHLNCY